MKNYKWIKWLFLAISLGFNVFIIVNSCLSGPTSSEESGRFASWFANVINIFVTDRINSQNFDSFAAMLRKLIGHFGFFTLSGILNLATIYLFLRESKLKKFYWFLSISLVIGLFLACLTEFIQIFTPGRSGNFIDILIDFGGYLLGIGVCFATLIFFNLVEFEKA